MKEGLILADLLDALQQCFQTNIKKNMAELAGVKQLLGRSLQQGAGPEERDLHYNLKGTRFSREPAGTSIIIWKTPDSDSDSDSDLFI